MKKLSLGIILVAVTLSVANPVHAFWELLFHYGIYGAQAISKLSGDKTNDEQTRAKEQKLQENVKSHLTGMSFPKSGLISVSIGDMIEISTFNENFAAIAYHAVMQETATGNKVSGVMVALIHLDPKTRAATFYKNEVARLNDLEAYTRNRSTLAEQFASLLKNDAIRAKPQSQPIAASPSTAAPSN